MDVIFRPLKRAPALSLTAIPPAEAGGYGSCDDFAADAGDGGERPPYVPALELHPLG